MSNKKREVTERDFRKPEFLNANPEDYEFRDDGEIVRKDRWEMGIRKIAGIVGFSGREGWEIGEIVERVRCAVDIANRHLERTGIDTFSETEV